LGAAEHGGAGGYGGAGGKGGSGGKGGDGGAGGGGGGAFEIIAQGKIEFEKGADLSAKGGDGASGTAGKAGDLGAAGKVGQAGQALLNPSNNRNFEVVSGAAGGPTSEFWVNSKAHHAAIGSPGNAGGDGGQGGQGGKGGDGSHGAGGAGGTVKLQAAHIETGGSLTVNVAGGQSQTADAKGGAGRVILVDSSNETASVTSSDYNAGSSHVNTNPADLLTANATTGQQSARIAGMHLGGAVSGLLATKDSSWLNAQSLDWSGIGSFGAGATDLLTVAGFETLDGLNRFVETSGHSFDFTGDIKIAGKDYDVLLIANTSAVRLYDVEVNNTALKIEDLTGLARVDGQFRTAAESGFKSVEYLLPGQVWITLIESGSFAQTAVKSVTAAFADNAAQASISVNVALAGDLGQGASQASGLAVATQTIANQLSGLDKIVLGEHAIYGIDASGKDGLPTFVVAAKSGDAFQVLRDSDLPNGISLNGASDLRLSADGSQVVIVTGSGGVAFDINSNGSVTVASAQSTAVLPAVQDKTSVTVGDTTYQVTPGANTLTISSSRFTQTISSSDLSERGLTQVSQIFVTEDDLYIVVADAAGGIGVFQRYSSAEDGFQIGQLQPRAVQVLTEGTGGALGVAGLRDIAWGAYDAQANTQEFFVASTKVSNTDTGGLARFVVDLNPKQSIRNAVISYSAIDSLTLRTQGGNDTVTYAKASEAAVTLETGSSADTIVIGAVGAKGLHVNAGAGTDTVILNNGADAGQITVDGGADRDRLVINALAAGSTVTLDGGAGADRFDLGLGAADTGSLTAKGGAGADEFRVSGQLNGTIKLEGGAEADTLRVDHASGSNGLRFVGGAGNDRVSVYEGGLNVTLDLAGDNSASANASDVNALELLPRLANGTVIVPAAGSGMVNFGSGRLNYRDFGKVVQEQFPATGAPMRVEINNLTLASASGGTMSEGDALQISLNIAVTQTGGSGTLKSAALDLNGDGIYETALAVPGTESSLLYQNTFSWSELAKYGITGDGTYFIGVQAVAEDGTTALGSASLTVADTPPAITLPAASATPLTVGDSFSFDLSASDFGAGDRVTQWAVDWGDGTPLQFYGAGAAEASHSFTLPGQRSVTVYAFDADHPYQPNVARFGAVTQGAFQRVIAKGSVALSGAQITAGEALSMTAQARGDVDRFIWKLNGKVVTGQSGATLSLDWAQLRDSYGINTPAALNGFGVDATAVYSDGSLTDATSATLQVANAAPQFSALRLVSGALASEIVEGDQVLFLVENPSDVAELGHYGLSFSFTKNGVPVEVTKVSNKVLDGKTYHAFAPKDAHFARSSGLLSIDFELSDTAGAKATGQVSVVVRDKAPLVQVSQDGDILEGGEASITVTLTDTDPLDEVNLITVDWGDGHTDTLTKSDVTRQGTVTTVTLKHLYRDNPASGDSYTVTVSARDSDGGPYEATTHIKVANQPPVISAITGHGRSFVGEEITLRGVITDAGAEDVQSLTVDWGDGSVETIALGVGADAFAVAHRFTDSRDAQITLTVHDGRDRSVAQVVRHKVLNVVVPGQVPSVSAQVLRVATESFVPQTGAINTQLSRGMIAFIADAPVSAADRAGYSFSYDFNNDGVFDIIDAKATQSARVLQFEPDNTPAAAPGSTPGVFIPAYATLNNFVVANGESAAQIDLPDVYGSFDSAAMTGVPRYQTLLGVVEIPLRYTQDGGVQTIRMQVKTASGEIFEQLLALPVQDIPNAVSVSSVQSQVQATDLPVQVIKSETLQVSLVTEAATAGDSISAVELRWPDGTRQMLNNGTARFDQSFDYQRRIEAGDGLDQVDAQITLEARVTITHADGSTTVERLTLRLDNSANALTASNAPATLVGTVPASLKQFAATAHEQETLTANFVAPITAGGASVTGWDIDWGDGTQVSLTSTPADLQSHVFADQTAAHDVQVQLRMSDGSTRSRTLRIAPSSGLPVTLRLAETEVTQERLNIVLDEGQSATLTLNAQTYGTSDAVAYWQINWGDGTSERVQANGAASQQVAHSYSTKPQDNGAGLARYEISVSAIDQTGAVVKPTVTPQEIQAAQLAADRVTIKTDAFGNPLTQPVLRGSDSVAFVEVRNAAPKITQMSLGATATEGDRLILSAAIRDTGRSDRLSAQIDWGDGSAVETFGDLGIGSANLLQSHLYAQNGSYQVTLTVSDENGGQSSKTVTVTVANAAPVISRFAADAAQKTVGDSFVFEGAFSDLGLQDHHVVQIDFGDGTVLRSDDANSAITFDQQNKTFSVSHAFGLTGLSQDYTITATVMDEAGGQTQQTTQIKVVAQPPQINRFAILDATVTEGRELTALLNFADLGATVVQSIEIDWGDGSKDVISSAQAVAGKGTAVLSPKHSYVQDGTYQVSARISDAAGRESRAVLTVTVQNAAPSDARTSYSQQVIVEQGRAYLSGSFKDLGLKDTHNIVIDWGDGSSSSTTAVAGPQGLFTFSADHYYQNDDKSTPIGNSYPVSLRITDDAGETLIHSAPVFVTNAAPKIILDNTQAAWTVNEGDSLTITGVIEDAGALDSNTLKVVWADGVTSTLQLAAVSEQKGGQLVSKPRSFSFTRSFDNDAATALGTLGFSLKLVATDDSNAQSPDVSGMVTVKNLPPELTNVTVTPAANEGDAVTLTGRVSDLGLKDAHRVYVDWGDGSAEQLLTVSASNRDFSLSHVYVNDGLSAGLKSDSYPIKLRVADEVTFGTGTTVHSKISNVAPQGLQLTLDAVSVLENGVTILRGEFTDPGVSDKHVLTVNWGDGQPDTVKVTTDAKGLGRFVIEHVYTNDDLSAAAGSDFVITAQVADGIAAGKAVKTTVFVRNDAPQILVPGAQLVNGTAELPRLTVFENGTATVTGVIKDAGPLDWHDVTIVWADGVRETKRIAAAPLTQGNGALVAQDRTYTLTRQFAQDTLTQFGQTALDYSLTVVDSSGAQARARGDLVVLNVTPTLTVTGLTTQLTENGSVTLSGVIDDIGTQDRHWITVDWGDGTREEQLVTLDPSDRSFTITHRYADDGIGHGLGADAYTITLEFRDEQDSASETRSTTVTNVAPRIADFAINQTSFAQVADVVLSGRITDPGLLDTHRLFVDWGNGDTTELFLTVDARVFQVSHQILALNSVFPASEDFRISIYAMDKEGAVSPVADTVADITITGRPDTSEDSDQAPEIGSDRDVPDNEILLTGPGLAGGNGIFVQFNTLDPIYFLRSDYLLQGENKLTGEDGGLVDPTKLTDPAQPERNTPADLPQDPPAEDTQPSDQEVLFQETPFVPAQPDLISLRLEDPDILPEAVDAATVPFGLHGAVMLAGLAGALSGKAYTQQARRQDLARTLPTTGMGEWSMAQSGALDLGEDWIIAGQSKS
ncbi:MAG: PKD domain-containing protein, partial [Pelagimonas sp.]|nr:PKD domain-containing protein [Pelagimonas sp.]